MPRLPGSGPLAEASPLVFLRLRAGADGVAGGFCRDRGSEQSPDAAEGGTVPAAGSRSPPAKEPSAPSAAPRSSGKRDT